MRFLIAGSSGFLGTRLRERLAAEGHEATRLVRREPSEGEVQWDPYRSPVDAEVVDAHDVVVNLAGSPNVGIPYSKRFRHRLAESRIRTTRSLAEGIARSQRKPTFLAQNGISWYGDQGSAPLDEQSASVGEEFMTVVSRDWQAATEPAATAGARVVVLRTAPILDRRSTPVRQLRLLFGAGLGGPLGSGDQFMPVISTRDWVAAVLHGATHEQVSGPVNLCCERVPTNAQFTKEFGRQLRRPTVLRVPAVVLRTGMGPLAHLTLDSLNTRPRRLLDTGFSFSDPDVGAVLAEALDPSVPAAR